VNEVKVVIKKLPKVTKEELVFPPKEFGKLVPSKIQFQGMGIGYGIFILF